VRALEDTLLHPAAFKVLVSLGAYADRRGCCYPSQGTLAKRLHVSRQAVNRQIQILIERGYLLKFPRTHPSGARLSCFYQILFDDPAGVSESDLPDQSLPCENLQEKDLWIQSRNGRQGLPGAINQKRKHVNPGIDPREKPMFQGIPHETNRASNSETITVSSPITIPVSFPDSSHVAQTSYLTTELTPREKGEKCAKISPFHSLSPSSSRIRKKPQSRLTSSGSGNTYKLEEDLDQQIICKEAFQSIGAGYQKAPPDLEVYMAISQRSPQGQEIDRILQSLQSLRQKYPDDESLKSYLMPFWRRWCNTRTVNGAPYNRNNSAWLTDWALRAATEDPGENFSGVMVSDDPVLYSRAMDPKPEDY